MADRSEHGTVLTYDTIEFPFSTVVAKILDTPDLEKIHELGRRSDVDNHDQDSDDHSIFYREYDQVRDLYDRFLVEWILPQYGEDLAGQRVPTFRVHRPGSDTFSPAVVEPGEVFRFDAVNNRHGNYPNDTDTSRVSFDFRAIPLRLFVDEGKSTVNAKRRMDLSGYYRTLSADGTLGA